MSSSHSNCDKCNKIFTVGGWDTSWCECGSTFCSIKCSVKKNDTCCICRKEHVTDYNLIRFLLERCDWTRKEATEALYVFKAEEEELDSDPE